LVPGVIEGEPMPDIRTLPSLTRRKVKRRRGGRRGAHNNARKPGLYPGTLGPAEAFDSWPITLKQPPNKGILTKRIKRTLTIEFLSGNRFQIRKSP
ncbi:MAG: hypothetical protein Q7T05_05450, partial [Dehalococcoidia bacterium]|nr:hypothetical protein [Dehalococcoidia bacterium]